MKIGIKYVQVLYAMYILGLINYYLMQVLSYRLWGGCFQQGGSEATGIMRRAKQKLFSVQ